MPVVQEVTQIRGPLTAPTAMLALTPLTLPPHVGLALLERIQTIVKHIHALDAMLVPILDSDKRTRASNATLARGQDIIKAILATNARQELGPASSVQHQNPSVPAAMLELTLTKLDLLRQRNAPTVTQEPTRLTLAPFLPMFVSTVPPTRSLRRLEHLPRTTAWHADRTA